MEVWKKVEGYDNYEVSNIGKVRTHNYMNRGETREMSPSSCRGYLQVNLFKDNKQKCIRIHRLVEANKVCACVKGRRKSTNGFMFKYKEEE